MSDKNSDSKSPARPIDSKLRGYWRAVKSVKAVVILIIAGFVGFLIVAFAQQAYVDARDDAARMARAAEHNMLLERYLQALMAELRRVDSPVLTLEQVTNMSGSSLMWKRSTDFELSVSHPPCIKVNFGRSGELQPHFDALSALKDEFEAALGNPVTWMSPARDKAYAGGGVRERDVEDLPSFWRNGGARSCLKTGNTTREAIANTDNWSREHEWIARQLEVFVRHLDSATL